MVRRLHQLPVGGADCGREAAPLGLELGAQAREAKELLEKLLVLLLLLFAPEAPACLGAAGGGGQERLSGRKEGLVCSCSS